MIERRPRSRGRSPRPFTLVILALLIVATAWLGWRLCRVWGAAAALRADAASAQLLVDGGIGATDMEEGIALLRATRRDLETLQDAAGPLLRLAPHLGWVPGYGPEIEAAPTLLEIALNLTAAGETVVEPLRPLLEQADEQAGMGGPTILEEATQTLAQARPQLAQALVAVRDARAARQALDEGGLDPRLRDWITRFDRYIPLLEQGARAGLLAPELLGADGPRTYLLLVQNEDELRATGGFISGVVQVTLDGGRIDRMPFEDSYAIDDFSQPYPEPPAPLREIMLAELWVFRDSNWSPDFPTSAQKAIELFAISRDAEIDGIIAVDQRAISLLLGPLGPLQVAGADQPVTGENVLQMARQAWAPGAQVGSDWWQSRKDIMGQVLDAAMGRVEGGLDREELVRLGSAALEALREKHFLLYFRDHEAAIFAQESGWDGALMRPSGDYLMVVDANMGFNKVNAVVEEELAYTVDLTDPTQPGATLTVDHHHPVEGWVGPCSQEPRYSATYAGMTERCYYDYLRVYAPSGGELLRATPHPVPGSILLSGQRHPGQVRVSGGEAGRTIFATFLVLRPGENLQTTFSYTLPTAVLQRTEDGWRYQLTVQKQPGTDARPLSIALELPARAEIVAADPPPAQRDRSVLVYDADLRTDVRIDVTWRPAGGQ